MGDWELYLTDMILSQVKYMQGTLEVNGFSLKDDHSF